MTYVITELCIGVKDRGCVDVYSVNCIYEGEDQRYIHPAECTGCNACERVCPVTAIFYVEAVLVRDLPLKRDHRGWLLKVLMLQGLGGRRLPPGSPMRSRTWEKDRCTSWPTPTCPTILPSPTWCPPSSLSEPPLCSP